MNGIKVTSQTMVSFNNCFSMISDDGYEYRIVNFYIENLDQSLLPIKLKKICTNVAIVDDERLTEKCNNHYCSVCCPEDYLLDHQKKQIEEDLKSGKRTEHITKDGYKIITYKMEPGPATLKTGWSVEYSETLLCTSIDDKEIVDIVKSLSTPDMSNG
jgi:hypothetical protein